MNDRTQILRCHIGGDWTALEMSLSLAHFNDLYNLRTVLQIRHEEWREFVRFYKQRGAGRFPRMLPWHYGVFSLPPLDSMHLHRASGYLGSQQQFLHVKRIRYESPGFKDLAGLGEIVGHLKDFILRILEFCGSRRNRELANEEHEIRNQRLRIENAREFLHVAEEFDLSPVEMRRLTNWVDERQERFIYLIREGKITGVDMLPSDSDNPDRSQ